MASAFDPSRFIAAEAARLAAEPPKAPTLAAIQPALAGPSNSPKPPATEGKSANSSGIATIAGGALQSREWFADLKRFVDAPCPPDMRAEAWDELTGETWNVAKRWSDEALAIGWSSLDLFGCNPDPRKDRVDRDGLVLAIVGLRTAVKLIEITPTHAVMEVADRSQSRLRHRRGPAQGAVHLWDAYRQQGGP